MSNFSCSLTNNSTSHSMENLAFHNSLRWKMIALPILTTSLIHFLFKRFGECTFWELGSERVKIIQLIMSCCSMWSCCQRGWIMNGCVIVVSHECELVCTYIPSHLCHPCLSCTVLFPNVWCGAIFSKRELELVMYSKIDHSCNYCYLCQSMSKWTIHTVVRSVSASSSEWCFPCVFCRLQFAESPSGGSSPQSSLEQPWRIRVSRLVIVNKLIWLVSGWYLVGMWPVFGRYVVCMWLVFGWYVVCIWSVGGWYLVVRLLACGQ